MKLNKITKENRKIVILIGVIITVVIVIGGYFTYKQLTNKDTNTSSNSSDTKETSSNTKKVNIDYKIGKEGLDNKLEVNGKKVNLFGNKEVLVKMNDALIVKDYTGDSFDIYVVDKDAKVISNIKGKSAVGGTETSIVYETRGNIPTDARLEDKTLILTSATSQDIKFAACNSTSDAIVRYEEKFEYLGNGKFKSTILSSMTAQDAIDSFKLDCSQ